LEFATAPGGGPSTDEASFRVLATTYPLNFQQIKKGNLKYIMMKQTLTFVLPLALALGLAGCGGGGQNAAEAPQPGSDSPTGGGGGFAGVYVSSLNRIAAALENVNDEASAREAAREIADVNLDLQAVTSETDGMSDAAKGMAFAARAQDLAQVQMRIAVAVQRINSTNIGLYSIISDEMGRMPKLGN
jgi:hypothetical protein